MVFFFVARPFVFPLGVTKEARGKNYVIRRAVILEKKTEISMFRKRLKSE